MLRDYSNKKTKPKRVKLLKNSKKLNHKLIFSIFLVLLVLFLSFLAIKIELSNLYRLKENERVLLINNQKPIAILFFNVSNNQLVVTDLRQSNLDFSGLEKEASLAGSLKKNLIYAFLLNTTFDQSYEYKTDDLSRESLLAFFKDQKFFYLFLKNRELLWREQRIDQEKSDLMEPMFNCPVALINTTGESGLASSLANILEKSAFSIIKKDNNTDDLAQTKIFYDSDEKSCGKLLDKLGKILPESLISADKQETQKHRAALVIYIGKDLSDLYVFFINLFHGQV